MFYANIKLKWIVPAVLCISVHTFWHCDTPQCQTFLARSSQNASKSVRLHKDHLWKWIFKTCPRLRTEFRSERLLNHSNTGVCFDPSHSVAALAVSLGLLSCWKTDLMAASSWLLCLLHDGCPSLCRFASSLHIWTAEHCSVRRSKFLNTVL